MIRARILLAVVIVADLTILFGGIPLLRDTYYALSQRAGDAALLTQLLAANLAMLLLVVSAMLAWGMLGVRAFALVRLAPITFGRPILARRTKYRQ